MNINLTNIQKAILIWVASILLAGFSSEMKKPTVTILSFLSGTASTIFLTKKVNLGSKTVETNPPVKEPIPTETPKSKVSKPIKQHTPPNDSNPYWENICAMAEDPESGAGVLKGFLEPLSLWRPVTMGKGLAVDILCVIDGTINHKGTAVPTDLEIYIELDKPIEWREAAQWVKANKFLGLKTALDAKGYMYSPHIKVTLPKEGGNQVVTLSISIEGALKM